MRAILLSGLALLLTTGVAVAQPPQPPAVPGTPAPAGAPPEVTTPPPAYASDITAFTAPGIRWWASLDYMMMWYTPMDTPPLIQTVPSDQANSPNPTGISTFYPANNRVSFGPFDGVRLSTGLNWENWGTEVSGFVLERKTNTGSAFNDGNPVAIAQYYVSAGSGLATSLYASQPGQYSGGVATQAQTQLWGLEANVRHAWYTLFMDSTDLISGFRYLDLREGLDITAPSFFPNGNSITVNDSIRTHNQFYGWQFGLNARLGGYQRGFGLDITTKSSVGGVNQSVQLVGSNTAVVGGVASTEAGGLYARGLNYGSFSRSKFAYIHDLDIKFTYNFSRWVQVSFGYSLIYLTSVVRPGNQIDTVVNDSDIRFVAMPTPSTAARPAFAWHAEELVVQGMTFGFRVQY